MQSLWMIVAGFMFAGMGVCVKLSADAGYSPAEIVFYRSFLACLAMIVFVRWRRMSMATPYWRRQIKRGVTGFCSQSVYFYAISLLPLATAVTLNYTSPVFLMLLLVAFRGLKFNPGVVVSLGLGFSGAACLLHPSFEGVGWFGGVMALVSAMLAAVTYFHVRDLGMRGEPEVRTVYYFSLISVPLSFIWVIFSGFHPLTPRGFSLLLGVGIFATLAQLAMTRAYARGKVLLCASLAYTTVLFATLFGVLFWGEHLDKIEVIGMALVVVSGIAANYFSSESKKGNKRNETGQ
ncbi:MAG: DMT family transporter [Azoarcus sp.]|nr:DMT family transporter [Azoarcus sp.]